jgi:hypothetical protein
LSDFCVSADPEDDSDNDDDDDDLEDDDLEDDGDAVEDGGGPFDRL